MARKHLNKSRVFLLFVFSVFSIVGTDSLRRDILPASNTPIIVQGSFKGSSSDSGSADSTTLGNGTQSATQDFTGISYLGFTETPFSSSQLSLGMLTIVNDTYPANTINNSEVTVKLSNVMNEYYSLCSDDIKLDSDAADELNQMMEDYNTATGLSDFAIYRTNAAYAGDDEIYTESFSESMSGYTVDLAIQGQNGLIEYDGADTQSWILENCTKYGFIQRYPKGKESATGHSECVWHLRYVGEVHAAVMGSMGLSLEEYNDMLKNYTIDSPLEFELNGTTYLIYYTASMGEVTQVRIPVSGSYTISGNNIDGFIVATEKQQ
jgi:D-alanyl-D-alanine carboxypeptidase